MEMINPANSSVAVAISVGLLLLVGLCAHRKRFLVAFLLLTVSLFCSFAVGLAPLLVVPAPGSVEYLQAAVGTIPPTIAAAALLWWVNKPSPGAALWFWVATAAHAAAVRFWYF